MHLLFVPLHEYQHDHECSSTTFLVAELGTWYCSPNPPPCMSQHTLHESNSDIECVIILKIPLTYKMARITAPELEQFIVATVELTGRVIGAGAYGSVEEVEIPGAMVAAKKLHQQLVNLGSPQQVDLFLAPLLIFLVSIDYIYWLISPTG